MSITSKRIIALFASCLSAQVNACSELDQEEQSTLPQTRELGHETVPQRETNNLAAESVDALRALGYIDFDERVENSDQVGVVHFEPEHSWPGYI